MSRVLTLWAGMTGTVLPFAGATAPTDWLLCYGQAVSRTTYAVLFAAIGTTYGAGDGSTTFNLPDLRGRVSAGVDNMGGTAAGRVTTAAGGVDAKTLGATGGESTHTLTAAEMAPHTHALEVNSTAVSGGGTRLGIGTGTAGSGTIQSGTNIASAAAHGNMQPTIALNHIIKI